MSNHFKDILDAYRDLVTVQSHVINTLRESVKLQFPVPMENVNNERQWLTESEEDIKARFEAGHIDKEELGRLLLEHEFLSQEAHFQNS